MDYKLDVIQQLEILNDVIEDLPITFIRQLKINYDAFYISRIFKKALEDIYNNEKIIFKELKYDNYKMEDLYYLISKTVHLLIKNGIKISFFSNYKKEGFNLFVNSTMLFSVFMEDYDLIIQYVK